LKIATSIGEVTEGGSCSSPSVEKERLRQERAVRLPLLPRASYPSPSISLNIMADSDRGVSALGAVLSVCQVLMTSHGRAGARCNLVGN
jgi:hypothetical protein